MAANGSPQARGRELKSGAQPAIVTRPDVGTHNMRPPLLVAPFKKILNAVDYQVGRSQLSLIGDRPGLLTFLFHAVMDEGASDEVDRIVDPTQTISTAALDQFIRYFKGCGYSFVSPDQILAGLPSGMRHILITFDDGYWNNLKALPVLESHEVPSVFFISTNYVKTGRAFWWDVIHRERLLQGVTQQRIWSEQSALKGLTHEQIESYLLQAFGKAALRPVSQEDRPMTPEELRDFSRHPLVHIGNHTHDHGILTNYAFEAVLEQITTAQEALHEWTGRRPRTISYPNGNFSADVLRATAQAGIELGLTLKPIRNKSNPRDRLQIGRFCITRNQSDEKAYVEFRAAISLRRALVRVIRP